MNFGETDEDVTQDSFDTMNEIIDTQSEYENMKKEIGRKDKPNTLMELATIYKRYLQKNSQLNPNIKNLDESDEINDCSFTTTVEMEDGTTEERII